MIVADTNVVSELMKPRSHPKLLEWLDSQSESVTITVITVEEIERGIALLPDGIRRSELAMTWNRLILDFRETLLTYDESAASHTASHVVHAHHQGKNLGLADAQIAGICTSNGLPLATRNHRDFKFVKDLIQINPFE